MFGRPISLLRGHKAWVNPFAGDDDDDEPGEDLGQNTEGFWDADNMPKQRPKPMPALQKFLDALIGVEVGLAREVASKGSSECRVCGIKNGSSTFYYNGWSWPSGYRHYLEAHNVHPSREFKRFILDLKE